MAQGVWVTSVVFFLLLTAIARASSTLGLFIASVPLLNCD